MLSIRDRSLLLWTTRVQATKIEKLATDSRMKMIKVIWAFTLTFFIFRIFISSDSILTAWLVAEGWTCLKTIISLLLYENYRTTYINLYWFSKNHFCMLERTGRKNVVYSSHKFSCSNHSLLLLDSFRFDCICISKSIVTHRRMVLLLHSFHSLLWIHDYCL